MARAQATAGIPDEQARRVRYECFDRAKANEIDFTAFKRGLKYPATYEEARIRGLKWEPVQLGVDN